MIGPIARKIIAAGRKHQRQTVVDLATVRRARDEMRGIIDRSKPPSEKSRPHSKVSSDREIGLIG